jgi:hypothetical protein
VPEREPLTCDLHLPLRSGVDVGEQRRCDRELAPSFIPVRIRCPDPTYPGLSPDGVIWQIVRDP